MDTPIACTLNPTQFAERQRLVNSLAQQAIERQDLPDGVRFRFDPSPDRVVQLARFVELEKACCPFLSFRIDAPAGGAIWLELTGPAPAQPIIESLIQPSAHDG